MVLGRILLAMAATLTVSGFAPSGAQLPVSSHVTLLKQIDVYSGVNDCWGYRAPNGTELAIYGHQTGTSFVNATDPANAAEVVNIPGPTSTWRDMFTYSHYCYIVTEGASAGTGLQIVDLSNPLAPTLVTTYTGNGFTTAHNLFIDVEAGLAFPVGTAPLGGTRVLSLANPTSPVELSHFTPYYIHDIFVDDGVGYAGAIYDGNLAIIDFSDPSNPVTLATHSYPSSFTHNAWPNAARTHVCTTDENVGGHLQVWDVTNLGNINLASEYSVPGAIVHDVRLRDDVVYLSYYTEGTRIVDLADPTNPVEIGFYDTSAQVGGFNGDWGVYPFRQGSIFYASDRQNGLHILDFTGTRAGFIEGVVRDASTSAPIEGATVRFVEDGAQITTAIDGSYRDGLPSGNYTQSTLKFGYSTDTALVTIAPGGTLTRNVSLSLLPVGQAKIVLTSAESGVPLSGVRAVVEDSPLSSFTSNINGEIVISGLPAGPAWTVSLGKFGRATRQVQVIAPPNGQSVAAYTMSRAYDDDFTADQGWITNVPGDTATDGIWERDRPIGSYFSGVVGANGDASPSGDGFAYITENHNLGAFAGTSDVDGGRTTLLSPDFNGAGIGTLTLTYKRWFSNRAPTQGADEFRCDVSNNGGTTWVNLETLNFGTDSWSAVSIPLSSVIAPTTNMRIRFVAEDLGDDHYVEGGVDEVKILSSATDISEVSSALRETHLDAPTPNPVRESAAFSFGLERAGEVHLEIFDVAGRRVAKVFEAKTLGAGSHRVEWNARDEAGGRIAAGIYFAKLRTPEGEFTRKFAVLK